MKLFAILVSLVALAIGADASCRGDCRIQCNPYNIPGACSNECVGRCMAARCPEYVSYLPYTKHVNHVY
jgi:hypothetical protein